MTNKSEVFISVDIETDGPIPSDFSMLSLGAAVFDQTGNLLSTFSANLETLPGASQHPDTMEWWSKNQEAYNATRQNLIDPKLAMEQFTTWVKEQPGIPVCVGYPVFFDYQFLYWYLIHFTGDSPFSFSALDIKTYASAMLDLPYRKSTKKNMPKHWFPKDPHTHIAVDDAIEQGKLFCNMLQENRKNIEELIKARDELHWRHELDIQSLEHSKELEKQKNEILAKIADMEKEE